MMETAASILWTLVGCYLALGLAVAPWLVLRGFRRLGEQTAAGTAGFRLVVLPGVVALWPWVLAWVARAGGRSVAGGGAG